MSKLDDLRILLGTAYAVCPDHNPESLLRALGEYVQAEVAPLVVALEDLRTHGTRHDLNPTLMGVGPIGTAAASPGGRGWYAYLKSMDSSVRQKATTALLRTGYIQASSKWERCTPDCPLYEGCPIRGT